MHRSPAHSLRAHHLMRQSPPHPVGVTRVRAIVSAHQNATDVSAPAQGAALLHLTDLSPERRCAVTNHPVSNRAGTRGRAAHSLHRNS